MDRISSSRVRNNNNKNNNNNTGSTGLCYPFWCDLLLKPSGRHVVAWRHWRHGQLTLQMLLATYEHHAAPRGQMTARSGRVGTRCTTRPSSGSSHPKVAGTEYFSLDVEDVPVTGSRPDRLAGVRPQERVWSTPRLRCRFLTSCAADGRTAGGRAPFL